MVFPRWAGLLIAGVILIVLGTLLGPALPGVLGPIAYWVLLILGIAMTAYGVWLLIVWLTRGPTAGPRDPHVP